jgi:hypothetical protein
MNITETPHYTLAVKKTWVESTKQWHIQFSKTSEWLTMFEIFLDDAELTKLKESL